MSTLLIASTSKTAQAILPHLLNSSHPYLLTTRPGTAASLPGHEAQTVAFDYTDPSTYPNPFTHPQQLTHPISSVYLLAPAVNDPTDVMIAFIDYAVANGARRFVLMCGSQVEIGEKRDVGLVWEYLAKREGVEFAVLRCSWFMENYLGPQYVETIMRDNAIYSACGEGKIPFISVRDIGAVAYHALTDVEPWNKDVRVLGPALLSLDDVAALLTRNLKRQITHIKVSESVMVDAYKDAGLSAELAEMLAGLETVTSQGIEARLNDVVESVTGKKGRSFEEMVADNVEIWEM